MIYEPEARSTTVAFAPFTWIKGKAPIKPTFTVRVAMGIVGARVLAMEMVRFKLVSTCVSASVKTASTMRLTDTQAAASKFRFELRVVLETTPDRERDTGAAKACVSQLAAGGTKQQLDMV